MKEKAPVNENLQYSNFVETEKSYLTLKSLFLSEVKSEVCGLPSNYTQVYFLFSRFGYSFFPYLKSFYLYTLLDTLIDMFTVLSLTFLLKM